VLGDERNWQVAEPGFEGTLVAAADDNDDVARIGRKLLEEAKDSLGGGGGLRGGAKSTSVPS
jgi:hypothetical protein